MAKLIPLSFPLVIHTLLQLDPDHREALFDYETRALFPFKIQGPSTDSRFPFDPESKHTQLTIRTLRVPSSTYDSAYELIVELGSDSLTLNPINYRAYSLHIDPQHPFLQTIPLSAFNTQIYQPTTLSQHETTKMLSAAFSHLPAELIRQWTHPMTLRVSDVEWPFEKNFLTRPQCNFTLAYASCQPGPLTVHQTHLYATTTQHLHSHGPTPTHPVTFSLHRIYQHFLLELLLQQLPSDWIPVQITQSAHDNRQVTLHPLSPYLKKVPYPAIAQQMASEAFNGALLHTAHPMAALFAQNYHELPPVYCREDDLPIVPFSSVYNISRCSPETEIVHPQQWLNTTLEGLHSKSQAILQNLLSC